MPIGLRTDFDAGKLRVAVKRSRDGRQARRLLALAAIYEGAKLVEAAKIGGVTLQIVRDWVMKFNALGPAALIDRKAPGQKPPSTPSSGRRWPRRSTAARFLRSTASCAGGLSISANGHSKSFE